MGCFTGDTLVRMADGSGKRISEIQTNELVRTGSRLAGIARVGAVYRVDADGFCELMLSSMDGTQGRSLCATKEHLLWIDGRGWTPAGEVRTGDWLQGSDGAPVRVKRTRVVPEPVSVYTLRLVGDYAFFANDILVHDACGANLPALEPGRGPLNDVER